MRLALITETYPPEINGVAMTLAQLVRGMVARGHTAQVIHPRQAADPPDDGAEHVSVPGIPLPRYQGLRMGLPATRRLVRLWRAQRPDVVHVATEGPLGRSALAAAQKCGIPLLSSFHTNFHQYTAHYASGLLGPLAVRYLRSVHRRAARTLVPSEQTRTALAALGFANLAVLGRGVDTTLFHPGRRCDVLRRSWGAGPQDLVVGYVGRLAREKNLPLSIAAWERFQRVHPTGPMVLIGDGPLNSKPLRERRDLVFCGVQRDQALARHLASLDLFFFASTTETFGNVVTEAMASGVCVLAYDYAAPAKMIRSWENGLTVPLDDQDAFLEAAEQLATKKAHVRTMGQAACARMQVESWDTIVQQYETYLYETIHGPAGLPSPDNANPDPACAPAEHAPGNQPVGCELQRSRHG